MWALDPGDLGEGFVSGAKVKQNLLTGDPDHGDGACVSQSLGTVLPPNGQEIGFLHTAAPYSSLCVFPRPSPPWNMYRQLNPFVFKRPSPWQAPAPTQASSLSSLFLQDIFLHFRLD